MPLHQAQEPDVPAQMPERDTAQVELRGVIQDMLGRSYPSRKLRPMELVV